MILHTHWDIPKKEMLKEEVEVKKIEKEEEVNLPLPKTKKIKKLNSSLIIDDEEPLYD